MSLPTPPYVGPAAPGPEDDAAPSAGTFAIDRVPGTDDAGVVATSVADDLRLARLHLRTGLHRIARAELETLAGSGDLDRSGILDLAEVRWRTGDLRGAGEGAAAYLALTARAGAAPSGPLAHAIVAEASAARGHLPEAGDAVGAALALLAAAGIADDDVPRALDALFAGIEPRAPWPEAALLFDSDAVADLPTGADRAALAVPAPLDVGESVRELLGEAEDALAEGDSSTAGVALALVLRLDQTRAGDVVALLDRAAADATTAGAVTAPSLSLVRGDALRAIGRDDLARVAYAEARPRARPVPAVPPAPDAGNVEAPAEEALAEESPTEESPAVPPAPDAADAEAATAPASNAADAKAAAAPTPEPPAESPAEAAGAPAESPTAPTEPAAAEPASVERPVEEAAQADGQPLPPS